MQGILRRRGRRRSRRISIVEETKKDRGRRRRRKWRWRRFMVTVMITNVMNRFNLVVFKSSVSNVRYFPVIITFSFYNFYFRIRFRVKIMKTNWKHIRIWPKSCDNPKILHVWNNIFFVSKIKKNVWLGDYDYVPYYDVIIFCTNDATNGELLFWAYV